VKRPRDAALTPGIYKDKKFLQELLATVREDDSGWTGRLRFCAAVAQAHDDAFVGFSGDESSRGSDLRSTIAE